MVEVTFKWEARKRADHKRSYNIARKRFLAGDMERGWNPAHAGYNFESFAAYESDLHSRVHKMVEEELAKIDPGVEKVKSYIYGTMDKTAAKYLGTTRDGKTLNLELNLNSLAPLYFAKDSEFKVRTYLRHEFWHHADRKIIARHSMIQGAEGIGAKISDHTITYMTDDEARLEFIKYLTLCRIEGFTKSYENDNNVLEMLFLLNMGKTLKRQTEIATNGLEHLNSPIPEVQFEPSNLPGGGRSINDKKHMEWFWKLHNMEYKGGFSPYTQGFMMFNVINAAERKKLSGKTEQFATDDEKALQSSVREKVLALRTFEDFYKFYYDCTKSLELPEEQVIIRPKYADRLFLAERGAGPKLDAEFEKQIKRITGTSDA